MKDVIGAEIVSIDEYPGGVLSTNCSWIRVKLKNGDLAEIRTDYNEYSTGPDIYFTVEKAEG